MSANTSLENKLLSKLHFYFGDKYDNLIGNRIIIVNGDVSYPNLGLSLDDLEMLSNNVNCVINSAGKVAHYGNYADFKKVNVDGTENLLKFCKKYDKRIYHISTLSVSGNTLAEGNYEGMEFLDDIIFRENDFYINQSLDNVYVRSKFEAERQVLNYILQGVDAYILRVRKFNE